MNQHFKVIDFNPISGGGSLVASSTVELPSGLRLVVNVSRNKEGRLWCSPASQKLPTGVFKKIVTFATPDLEKAWQALTMAALDPHLQDLDNTTATRGTQGYASF